ncbi:hypothetical protein C6P40_004062 [Pichia californica]|uniref:Uncharacterized protein n=1 Tax=Pichia californica TaxID=460514 RepID=A0A9P6WN61_9ASCO|nr:hypothetical protein C6P42_001107 [[Candida] californica]KAG0690011.1 hypothetical protein C6P40_004062 [[Candida] californica]
MDPQIIMEMQQRGISEKFCLQGSQNLKQYANMLQDIVAASDRNISERNELLKIIKNEANVCFEKSISKSHGLIEPGNMSKEEIIAFDQIASAMKYIDFKLLKRHPSKTDA